MTTEQFNSLKAQIAKKIAPVIETPAKLLKTTNTTITTSKSGGCGCGKK